MKRFSQDLNDGAFAQAVAENPILVKAWKKMDDFGADVVLRKNPGALDALAKKDAGELVPDPSEYLSQSYINSHLSKFENDDIVRITSQSNIDKYNGSLGGPDSFVTTRTEFVEMYAEVGGSLREIEKRMGFNEGDLGDDTIFALIKQEDIGTFKMPSGNEGAGANTNWIPGGKTSGGMPEATLDLTTVTDFEKLFE